MNLDELLQEMRDEEARGLQGPAHEAFWRAVHGELWAFFRRRYNSVVTDELTQAAGFVVVVKLEDYERQGPDTFVRWLRAIAKNEIRHYQRAPARHVHRLALLRRAPRPAPATSPESRRRRKEQLELIAEHKKDLTTMQREAVEYADAHELAAAKGITVEAARMRWRRAIAALKKLLRRARRTPPTWRSPPTSRVRIVTPR